MNRVKSIHFTEPEADSLRCSIEKIIEQGLRGVGSSGGEPVAFRLPERVPFCEADESSEDGPHRVRDEEPENRSE
jgi:hypothetical protein